jgi:hypothetical protein
MNKILLGITALSVALFAEKINPLGSNFKSLDNGGIKHAIDAYKDGIGAILVDKPGEITNNSAVNNLVFKYGEDAKLNNLTLANDILNASNVAVEDKTYFINNMPGLLCNDGNTQTINDSYNNEGICIGTSVPNGTTCNDGDAATLNDIYTNGICAGTPPVVTGSAILTSLYNSSVSNVPYGIYDVGAGDQFVLRKSDTTYNFNNSIFKVSGSGLGIFGISCMKYNVIVNDLIIRAVGTSHDIFTTHPYTDGYYGSSAQKQYLNNVIIDASKLSYTYTSYLNGPTVYCSNTTIILPTGRGVNHYINVGSMVGCNFITADTAQAQAIIANIDKYIK